MQGEFEVGDHVSWDSEAGRVKGTIRRKIKAPIKFKGYTVHASSAAPQRHHGASCHAQGFCAAQAG